MMSLSHPKDSVQHRGRVLTPPFVIAVGLLGLTALVAGPGAVWLNINQAKESLPLREDLGHLDENALYPYRVVKRHVLDSVIVDALGTDSYLKWSLENTSIPEGKPLRFAELFVTYYTGGANLVPHTPDVCYLGNGYSPAQPHEDMKIVVPTLPKDQREVPIRVCTFAKTAIFGHDATTVVYTFYCNGAFLLGSRFVRERINRPTFHHAYFSKVEVSFPGASREQSVEGAASLFRRVLPVLLKNHWPDFDAAERANHK